MRKQRAARTEVNCQAKPGQPGLIDLLRAHTARQIGALAPAQPAGSPPCATGSGSYHGRTNREEPACRTEVPFWPPPWC